MAAGHVAKLFSSTQLETQPKLKARIINACYPRTFASTNEWNIVCTDFFMHLIYGDEECAALFDTNIIGLNGILKMYQSFNI